MIRVGRWSIYQTPVDSSSFSCPYSYRLRIDPQPVVDVVQREFSFFFFYLTSIPNFSARSSRSIFAFNFAFSFNWRPLMSIDVHLFVQPFVFRVENRERDFVREKSMKRNKIQSSSFSRRLVTGQRLTNVWWTLTALVADSIEPDSAVWPSLALNLFHARNYPVPLPWRRIRLPHNDREEGEQVASLFFFLIFLFLFSLDLQVSRQPRRYEWAWHETRNGFFFLFFSRFLLKVWNLGSFSFFCRRWRRFVLFLLDKRLQPKRPASHCTHTHTHG